MKEWLRRMFGIGCQVKIRYWYVLMLTVDGRHPMVLGPYDESEAQKVHYANPVSVPISLRTRNIHEMSDDIKEMMEKSGSIMKLLDAMKKKNKVRR